MAAVPWELLAVGGKLVIAEVLNAIAAADVSVFEVSDLNQNFMFELGYAIGAERRIFLLRDPTDEAGERRWKQVRVLTSIGYSPYSNSEDIRVAFARETPYLSEETVYQQSIAASLQPTLFKSLFYVASPHNSEAERDLRRRVNQEQKNGLSIVVDDATESSVQSLGWYGQQIYASAAAVVHFLSPRRTGSEIHNARSALISGLCRGMDRPVLMVAPDEYPPPLDYQDLLYVYRTARDCASYVDRWLTRTLEDAHVVAREDEVRKRRLNLATELRNLRLGDPVAENEADLLSEYFIETTAFDDVLSAKAMIFVGRKGTGKTANLLRAAEILGSDRRNLVVAIKPFGYELDGVVSVLRRFSTQASQDFLIESLWKFLLLSEISLAAAAEIDARPAPVIAGSPEQELVEYLRNEGDILALDFAVRLERAIAELQRVAPSATLEEERAAITQALHETHIQALRGILGRLLRSRTQVAVLVDNLDQPWDKSSDLDALTTFLLGLLTATSRLEADFRKSGGWREPVPLTVGIFLRSASSHAYKRWLASRTRSHSRGSHGKIPSCSGELLKNATPPRETMRPMATSCGGSTSPHGSTEFQRPTTSCGESFAAPATLCTSATPPLRQQSTGGTSESNRRTSTRPSDCTLSSRSRRFW